MGCNDVAPGTQPGYRSALNGCDRDFACFIADLFIEAHTQQFLPLPFNLAGQLASRDGGEQALDTIQGTVGIIGAEGFLVRPFVAYFAQFADQGPFDMTQHISKDHLPLIPHHHQQYLRIAR